MLTELRTKGRVKTARQRIKVFWEEKNVYKESVWQEKAFSLAARPVHLKQRGRFDNLGAD